jgi:hypothetical protein
LLSGFANPSLRGDIGEALSLTVRKEEEGKRRNREEERIRRAGRRQGGEKWTRK